MGGNLGTFYLAAEELRQVQFLRSTDLNDVSTSAVQLHLAFDSTTNSLPTQLRKVHSKLEVAAYYGTSPWESCPTMKDMKRIDANHEAYITATPLRSLELKYTQWEQLTSFESVVENPEALALESSVGSSGIVHHFHHNPSRPARTGSSCAYFSLVSGVSHVRRWSHALMPYPFDYLQIDLEPVCSN